MKRSKVKKLIFFSNPHEKVMRDIVGDLFPETFKVKKFAYVPAEGIDVDKRFEFYWRELARIYNAEFSIIDITKKDFSEHKKISEANIIVVSGGNVCHLLNYVRENGFDKTLKKFLNKSEFVYAGFSAGAMLLTPTIKIGTMYPFDENDIGLSDLVGLNVVSFEIFPHFQKKYEKILNNYDTSNKVETLREDEYLILNKK